MDDEPLPIFFLPFSIQKGENQQQKQKLLHFDFFHKTITFRVYREGGKYMSDYHEKVEDLSSQTKNFARALHSLKEEIEAVDWYNQRVDASDDPELAAIMAHRAADTGRRVVYDPVERDIREG